jgi:uncharacterized membrane protein
MPDIRAAKYFKPATLAAVFALLCLAGLTTVDGNVTKYWETYTLSYVFANPAGFLRIVLNTLKRFYEFYLFSAVGSLLGPLSIPVPITVVIGFLLAAFLSAVSERDGILKIQFKHKVLVAAISLSSFCFILLSMFVAWTSTALSHINGVQGRYFLPFLPLIFFLLPVSYIKVEKNIDRGIVVSLCVLQIVTVSQVFGHIIAR